MNNLIDLARQAASRWPDRIALVFDETGETLTFSEFDARTDAIAASLAAAGVGTGDRVLVATANRLLFPLAWFGILKAGAAIVPINIAYRAEDAQHLAMLAEPKAAFCDAPRAPLIASLRKAAPSLQLLVCEQDVSEAGFITLADFAAGTKGDAPIIDLDANTLANIQFTSGTTGLPKGCMLTHGYWLELARAVRKSVIEIGPEDCTLTAQAFSYLDPQWALVLSLMSGSRLVVLERFRPSQLWEKMVEYDVSFFYCLAAMPLMLLACDPVAAERKHRLRVIMCSAIPTDRHIELEERFNVPWLEAYGTTETGSDIGIPWPDHLRTRGIATIGKPLPHREAALLDENFSQVVAGSVGELVIRGPGIMLGYWRNTAATVEAFHNGWYRTGDLARRDEDGFYYLIGRRKDAIRRAGENIAAAEVEGVLHQHPAVVLAACIAVPDPIRNEEIKVFVITTIPVSVAELVLFLEARLARFKIPRYWAFADSLPMTPSERVAKPQLSRELGADVIDRMATVSVK